MRTPRCRPGFPAHLSQDPHATRHVAGLGEGPRTPRLLFESAACTLPRVLSEGRHRAPDPSPRINPALFVVPILVVVAAGAAFFLFSNSGGSGGGILGGGDDDVPSFRFEVDDTVAVASTDSSVKQLAAPADQAAKQASHVLSAVYTEAFLNPDNWGGEYDGVWDNFDEGAASTAQKDVPVLTAGIDAGYDSVQPAKGTLDAKVLLDDQNQPFAVVATVTFS